MKTVVIAGGTGLIGRRLEKFLTEEGFGVLILTRNPRNEDHVFWNPAESEMDTDQFEEVEVIINLCGAGVADKSWSSSRKKELIESRVVPAQFLYNSRGSFPKLKHYISASGVTCYGYDNSKEPYSEADVLGNDFLSEVVREWEAAGSLFEQKYRTAYMRIGIVLTWEGGALPKLAKPIKMGAAAAIGSGKQWMQWIHIDDVVRAFHHVLLNELSGKFNTIANNTTNREFTCQLAKQLKRRMWLPNVPAGVMKLLLGEMSEMILKGVKVDNKKLLKSNFDLKYAELREALS